MKKNLFVLVILVACMSLVGCATKTERLNRDVNSFISEVEEKSDSFSEEEWAQADLKYEQLMIELENNYDIMTPSEKEAAMKTLGRYYGIRTRHSVEEAAKGVKEVLEALPAFIEGFSGVFGNGNEE